MRNFYTNYGLTVVTIPDYWWVSPPPPPALAPDPAQTGFVDVRNNSDVWPIHHSTINRIIYGENHLFLFIFWELIMLLTIIHDAITMHCSWLLEGWRKKALVLTTQDRKYYSRLNPLIAIPLWHFYFNFSEHSNVNEMNVMINYFFFKPNSNKSLVPNPTLTSKIQSSKSRGKQ